MNDPGRSADIRIRGYALRVPILDDEPTTQTLARQLESRLADIEEHAGRVDTLGFALRLAYDLAAELHHTKARGEADLKSTLVALDQVQTRLNKLLDRLESRNT